MNEYQEIVDQGGQSLEDAGVTGHGLERSAALKAISVLSHHKIPILGGDVFRLSNGKLELTYDNWHIDKKDDEATKSYAIRSAQISENYVRNYHEPEDVVTLYHLILGAGEAEIDDGAPF